MFHEMLTGHKVKPVPGQAASILSALNMERPTLADAGVDASPRLQQLLDCMLAQVPENRFQNDDELLDALAEVGAELGVACERAI